MSGDDNSSSNRRRQRFSRRQLLATLAGVTIGATAGCSSLTDQEFAAEPVGLPEEARTEVTLAKTAGDALKTTRQIDAVDAQVTITSHTGVYTRGKAFEHMDYPLLESSLLEAHLSRVNDGAGPGSAVVATASDLGRDEVHFDLEGVDFVPASLPGDRVNFVVPAGVRGSDGGTASQPIPNSVMVLGAVESGQDSRLVEMTKTAGVEAYVVQAKDCIPGETGTIDRDWSAESARRWLPPVEDLSPNSPVMLVLGDNTSEEMLGIPAGEMPGERIGEGKSFDGINPMIFGTLGGVGLLNPPFTEGERPLEVGTPTWVGGATYGLGVLSTPTATIAGQSVNPVAGMSFEELLTSEQARGFLQQTGVTDAGDVEWLAGPREASEMVAVGGQSPFTILDNETGLTSFLGVVSGEDGPWGVGVHMARVENERDGGTDVVVTAATHRWPVASADGLVGRDERFTGILGSIIIEARSLTAAVGTRILLNGDVDTVY